MNSTEDKVYIDSPDLLTSRQHTRDTVFTAIMWAIYIYLFIPLISLFAWLLGIEFAYDVMIRSGGARDLGSVLIVYGVIVLVILAMVTIWSLGNRLRYGKLHRRHSANALSTAQMAAYFEVELESVDRLRSTQSVSIEFDTEGRPVINRYQAEH